MLPGGEMFTSLERGVIDATEWVGPLHDLRMGFYQAAKYYYYPEWHEPATCLEVIFNKKIYDGLPNDLKAIPDAVAMETNLWSLSEFEASITTGISKGVRPFMLTPYLHDPVLKKLTLGGNLL